MKKKLGRKTSPRPLFVFKKSVSKGKIKWFVAWFHYISIALTLAYKKNKLYKTLRLLIQRYAQF